MRIVALRKESVDRNNDDFSVESGEIVSLSARRAWIEIFLIRSRITGELPSLSARRAWIEILLTVLLTMKLWSLSARRAWIEIL